MEEEARRVGEGVSERGVGESEQRGFQERGVESREVEDTRG